MAGGFRASRVIWRRLGCLSLIGALVSGDLSPAYYGAWAAGIETSASAVPASAALPRVASPLLVSLDVASPGSLRSLGDISRLDLNRASAGASLGDEVLSPANRAKVIWILQQARVRPIAEDSAAEAGLSDEATPEDAARVLRAFNEALDGVAVEDLREPAAIESVAREISKKLELNGIAVSLARESSRKPALSARQTWRERRDEVLHAARALRAQLAGLAQRRESEAGTRQFEEEIDGRKIAVSIPGVGEAKLTKIENSRAVRVVHAPTELAVLFIDSAEVSDNSVHLRKYVARQHIEAGTTRQDEQRGRGRDLVIVRERGGRAEAEQLLERSPKFSRAWWADQWHATVKKPSVEDFWLGLYCSGVQMVLASVLGFFQAYPHVAPQLHELSAIQRALQALPHVNLVPVGITGFFGLVIGIFSSTYYNLIYRGGKKAQFIKSSMISLLFAYLIVGAVSGWNSLIPRLHGGTVVYASIAWANVLIWINVIANNLGKVALQQIGKIGRDNRMFQKPLVFFSGRIKMNRASFYNQNLYMINWTGRYIALIFGLWSLLAYLSMIPVARLLVVRYVKKHNFRETAEVLAEWERDKARVLFIPKKLASWLRLARP